MLPAGFEISTDVSRIDVDVVNGFLTTSYWGQGRTREVVERLPAVLLRTRDAHGLYAQFGFEPAVRPEELMTLRLH